LKRFFVRELELLEDVLEALEEVDELEVVRFMELSLVDGLSRDADETGNGVGRVRLVCDMTVERVETKPEGMFAVRIDGVCTGGLWRPGVLYTLGAEAKGFLNAECYEYQTEEIGFLRKRHNKPNRFENGEEKGNAKGMTPRLGATNECWWSSRKRLLWRRKKRV
jgi:hypothetical protein